MRPLKSNKPPRMIDGCVDGDSPTVFVSTNEEKQKEYLDIVLKQLKNKGIQDVVILTCKTENTSVISSYSEGGRYKSNGSFYQFTTCRKYKGLEADAVVLIDVDKNVLIGDNNLIFYVGASRARFFLSIICHMNEEDCTEAVNTLKASNAKLKRPKKALAATLNALLQMLN